ncbi:hypothetical protein CYMTET_41950 [Cymbomonas tetramitiformis]|uniref:FCP1 homology domain-containing protein n=1 Tax=Cymbomonas tetramitiformis TaxID=36881 RepID=A0AAE0C540_9CHLO|nr:hypothetical protein CYMTET_41950 [Cymbomonas tetramitiformis]
MAPVVKRKSNTASGVEQTESPAEVTPRKAARVSPDASENTELSTPPATRPLFANKEAAGPSDLITSSTRKPSRGNKKPSSAQVLPATTASFVTTPSADGTEDEMVPSEAAEEAGLTDATPRRIKLLGNLFSPVFTLWSRGNGEQSESIPEGDEACEVNEGQELQVFGYAEEPSPDVGDPSAPETKTASPKAEDTDAAACALAESAQIEATEAEEEEDYEEDDFDPYLFIKKLPPLEQCVEYPRKLLLPAKTRRAPRITLVLDLDETLVHSTLEDYSQADFNFPVHFNNQEHMVNVRRRPGLETFMKSVAEKFEVVVFTASQRIYAEQLLNILDPGRILIRHRIFRESCVYVEGNYLKDLSVLGRDLRHVIIVDNSPQAFGFQLDNGIPIESWFDDPFDGELLEMLPFLQNLADADDVRPAIASAYKLREKVSQAGTR